MKFRFFLLIALFSLTIFTPVSGQERDNYVIIYDEGHQQYFTSDMMKTALDSLSSSLQVDITVKGNYDAFNATSLQGADLVIISNPGLTGSGSPVSIGSEEKQSLDDFVAGGGSAMYLSNPFSFDRNVSGKAKPMNDLLINTLSNEYSIYKIVGDNENVSIIADDFNNDGNFTHVYSDINNFDDDVFFTELNNLTESRVLVYSTWVKGDVSPKLYANVSTTAYSLDQDFNVMIDPINKDPNWMGAVEYEDGRAMLLGSTIMFSDMAFDGSSNWIDQESNLELFQNLIAWLLQITPIDEVLNLIDEPFSFFAWFNFWIGIGIAFLFISVWMGSMIRSGRLSWNKIFALGMEKKIKSKKGKKGKSTTSKDKKKQKQRRKRT